MFIFVQTVKSRAEVEREIEQPKSVVIESVIGIGNLIIDLSMLAETPSVPPDSPSS